MTLYDPEDWGTPFQLDNISVDVINDSGFELPKYQTNDSSGMDLQAYITEETFIKPQSSMLIKTQLKVKLPQNYEFQIRSRSGLAAKHNVFVLNSPGTIDADYQGYIGVVLFNAGSVSFQVKHGDRIAQMILQHVPKVMWNSVNEFYETSERGTGGFGSTGV